MSEEEKMEFPSFKEIIMALAKDIAILENEELNLSKKDIREALANIIANQIIIFNIIKNETEYSPQEELPSNGLYS